MAKRIVGRSAIVPGGAALFQRVYTRLGCEGRPPRFRVEFYPYSSLVLTIRRREEVVWVRLSDLLRSAPLGVLEGAAALLLSRVFRRRASASLTAPYLDYARSGRTRERINRMRRRRVRPGAAGPQGRHFDLEKLFEDLNARYFDGRLQRPHIGWSRAAIRRGICLVSRDAACEASHAALGLQSGVALAGIPRGREALRGIRARAPGARPLGALKRKKEEISQRRGERSVSVRLKLYFFFRSTSLRSLSIFLRILSPSSACG